MGIFMQILCHKNKYLIINLLKNHKETGNKESVKIIDTV